mmetsp:Transcript_65434/g.147635  ORF Transcript_65434/g.147635 Transcript_65434/m.147635 type:complete len:296 (-) Transcript_65434:1003-1890(-)
MPVPTKMLKIGPPKHPAAAIRGCPSLANATSQNRSPSPFPHARSVTPIIASLTRQTTPRTVSIPTTSLAIRYVHTQLITKARAMKTPFNRPVGSSFCDAVHHKNSRALVTPSARIAIAQTQPKCIFQPSRTKKRSWGAKTNPRALHHTFQVFSSTKGHVARWQTMIGNSTRSTRRQKQFRSSHPTKCLRPENRASRQSKSGLLGRRISPPRSDSSRALMSAFRALISSRVLSRTLSSKLIVARISCRPFSTKLPSSAAFLSSSTPPPATMNSSPPLRPTPSCFELSGCTRMPGFK